MIMPVLDSWQWWDNSNWGKKELVNDMQKKVPGQMQIGDVAVYSQRVNIQATSAPHMLFNL